MPSRTAMPRALYLKVARVQGILSQMKRIAQRAAPWELMYSEWTKLTTLGGELAETLESGITHEGTARLVEEWKSDMLEWLAGRRGAKRPWQAQPFMSDGQIEVLKSTLRMYLNGVVDIYTPIRQPEVSPSQRLWGGIATKQQAWDKLPMPKVLKVLDPQTFDFAAELPGEKLHNFFMDVFARWQEKTGDESGIETWTLPRWWRHIADEWEVTMTEIGPGLRAKGSADDNIAQVDQG